MAQKFVKTLGPSQPDAYQDPEQAALEALQARMAQPRGPVYSPEEVQARRNANQQQYALGMLGQLSGHEGLSNVGGQVLKQAVAARQQKMNERGMTDPLSGEFTYDPDFLAQRDEQQAAQIQQRIAQRQGTSAENRIKAQERAELARENQAARAFQAQENRLARAAARDNADRAGGNPTGDERNAANFAAIMQQATGNIEQHEGAGTQTNRNQALAAIPLIGNTIASASMTPAQQAYAQAAQQWVRAKLRKESGATIGDKEMADEIRTFFPQPEDGPLARAQKKQARLLANRGMAVAAGRAQIPSLEGLGGTTPPPPGAVDVGALLAAAQAAPVQRNPMGAPTRPQALPLSNPKPAAGGGANRIVKADF